MAGLWHSAGVSAAKRPDRRSWLSVVRHPARRDGIMALALFLLPWLLALGLERRDHHLDGGTIAILVSVSLGLPVLWLTWALARDSRADHEAGEQRLGEVADQLAVAVRAQWEAEAAVRRLNDP